MSGTRTSASAQCAYDSADVRRQKNDGPVFQERTDLAVKLVPRNGKSLRDKRVWRRIAPVCFLFVEAEPVPKNVRHFVNARFPVVEGDPKMSSSNRHCRSTAPPQATACVIQRSTASDARRGQHWASHARGSRAQPTGAVETCHYRTISPACIDTDERGCNCSHAASSFQTQIPYGAPKSITISAFPLALRSAATKR